MRLRWLALVAAAGLLASAQKCDVNKACPAGQKLVVRPDGTLACRAPEPEPTSTTTTTSTTSTSTTTTTSTTSTTTLPPPTPQPGCSLPAMPECGRPESATGVFGCCWTDKAKPLPSTPFDAVVEDVQDEIERKRPDLFDQDGRADEDVYVSEVVRRLRARGLCAVRGAPGDEVGLKASNTESFQYDVHLGNGRPRHDGYTAYCSPARF